MGLVDWLIIVALPAWGGLVETIPNPRQDNHGWVSDTAEVLSPQSEARINQAIDHLKSQNGAEMAVVTIKALPDDQTAKELATELFNHWGIGEAGRDNGLLFLVAVANRRMEVETGYGAEAVLPDGRVGRILRQKVAPRFRTGDIEGGIVVGSETFVDALSRTAFTPGHKVSSPVDVFWIPVLLTLFGASLLGWCHLFNLSNSPLVLPPVGYTRTNSDPMLPKRFFLLVDATGLMALLSLMGALLLLFRMSPGAILSIVLVLVMAPGCIPLLERKCARGVANARRMRQLVRCKTCGGQMHPVPSEVVAERLSPPEAAARDLADVAFEAWRCTLCHPHLMLELVDFQERTNDLHLFAYEKPSLYSRCPRCDQKAVMQHISNLADSPLSLGISGVRRITKHCLACGHESHQDIELVSSRSGDSNGDEFGGGGSSGGDFGGGSSGGGGAGSDW
ncbi:YgcG family protein [Cyanobium sp. Cruz-8H5]|nr:TPM domain-containing protein [Cyanobium sp. Cruz-8H5]MCP9866606.1 TPM domain-containing protein [Cyanobium sp. Cruz-8D1]